MGRACLRIAVAGLAAAGATALAWAGVAEAAPAGDGGTVEVSCRNEREVIWDDHQTVEVPADAPQWWLDEIAAESRDHREGFEGRGETSDVSDSTTNLGAQGCSLARNPPDERTCVAINEEKASLREAEEAGVLTASEAERLESLEWMGSGIVPDGCWGSYPSSRYDMTWDARSMTSFEGWGDRFTGWVSAILFGVGKLAIRLTLWLVGFAFAFDIGEYHDTVAGFAADFDHAIVHLGGRDFTLVTVAWFVLFATAGFFALKGKVGKAGAEIGTSILLAGLATVVLGPMDDHLPDDATGAPAYAAQGYMDSLGELVDRSSLAPLLAAHSRSPNEDLGRSEVEELLRDTQGGLHEEFVEAPYFYINWNKDVSEFSEEPASGGSRSCAQIQRDILTVTNKPRGWPTRYMARHGCIQEATFNSSMTPSRFAATVLVMVVALFVSAAVGLAAVTLLMAKYLVAVLFAALPLAAVAAILPGWGRRLAWWWLGSLAQLWVAALAMGSVVMLLLFGMDALRYATGSLQLAERWLMVLAVVGTIYMVRKRLGAASRRMARGVSMRLENAASNAEGRIWEQPVQGAGRWAGTEAMATTGGELSEGSGWGGGPGHASWAADARPPGPQAPRPASRPPQGQGGFDLESVDRGAARAGNVAATAGVAGARMGFRVAGLALRTFVSRPGRFVLGGAYRMGRQRRQENRTAFKYAALRAALNDQQDIVGRQRTAAQTGKPLFLPGDHGPQSQRYPTLDQALKGEWKFNMRRGYREIKAGRMAPFGGEQRREVKYYGGRYLRPRKVRAGDGTWRKAQRPPLRQVPKANQKEARQPLEKIITRHRRDLGK